MQYARMASPRPRGYTSDVRRVMFSGSLTTGLMLVIFPQRPSHTEEWTVCSLRHEPTDITKSIRPARSRKISFVGSRSLGFCAGTASLMFRC